MINLVEALADYYAANAAERGDESLAHVSDTYKCLREVWARRSGHLMMPHDAPTRMKFALGHAVEEHVAIALAERLSPMGWRLERDVTVMLGIEGGTLWGGLWHEDIPNAAEVLKGHVDFVLRAGEKPPIVVEVKSTSFFKGKAPVEASEHYRIQAAAYAKALRAEKFVILVVCRESGRVVEFWHDTEDYEELLKQRVAEVIAMTSAAVIMPPAEPRFGWQCRYCSFADCEKFSR